LPTSVHPLNQLASTELTMHPQAVLPKFIMACHHHRGERWWHTTHLLYPIAATKVSPLGHPYYRPRLRSTQRSPPNLSPNSCWWECHQNPAQLGSSAHVPWPRPPSFTGPPACTPSTWGRCNTIRGNGCRPQHPIVCISCTSSDPAVVRQVG
jgi:hypothetical protein